MKRGAILLFLLACLRQSSPAVAQSSFATSQKVFYVMAPGSDQAIPLLLSTMAAELQKRLFKAADNVWVIPRSQWQYGDLFNQCSSLVVKPIGGLILEATVSESSTEFYLLLQRGWARAHVDAQIVDCSFPTPQITWSKNEIAGFGNRNSFSFVTIAALGSYFANQGSNSRSVAIGAAFFGSSQNVSLPPLNTVDYQRQAVRRLVEDFLRRLEASCAAADATFKQTCSQFSGLSTSGPVTSEASKP